MRNAGATVARTMDSLLGQSLPPSSILAIDDGSTDETAAILAKYEAARPGTVRVARTGSSTTDYTRIPRLLNMGLDPKYDYHMLGAGDGDFARDYAEAVLSEMEADPSVAVASGDCMDPPARDPRGLGRFVRQSWFFSEYERYPETVGFEPETVLRARLSGMAAAVYPGARYEHLDRLGHGHNFSEFGHSMRALGYHPLYALGRCARCLAVPGMPRRGALNMLWQYLAYRPAGTGYYAEYPAEFRGRVRRMQAAEIKRALAGRRGGRGVGAAAAARRPRRPFTVVVPFRDTPRGREFAARSLPSAAALRPDEVIVGVDAPAAPGLAGFLRGAAAAGGPAPLRAVEVARSPEWRMHAARVVHECFGECRTDTALLYNIDTVLRSDVLAGLGMVGPGGAALASFALRLRTDGPGSAVRYWAHRARSRLRGAGNSGTFWVHLPDYFGRVDAAEYARVANGFDTYVFEILASGPGTRAVADRTIGADCMDRENGDLEWRQFGYGLWLYANRRGTGPAAALLSAASIAKHAAVNSHPHSIRGWRWARAHPGSEQVRVASRTGYAEWTAFHEPDLVGGLADWPERGTGLSG